MARELIDSFEAQDLSLWSYSTGAIVSTAGLDMCGNYCLNTGSGDTYISVATFHGKYFAFMWRAQSSSVNYILVYETSAGVKRYYLTYDNSNHRLHIYNGGGDLYGPSNTIYVGTTYFIQIYGKTLDGTSTQSILYVDGVKHIDHIWNTTSNRPVNDIYLGDYCYYDNFIMDNSEIPEKTEIILLKPNGVGNYSDFMPTPSGSNNYTCVDEVPYSDSDYVSSGIVNAIDTYTLEDMPVNVKSVKCVQMQARALKDFDSPLTKFNFVMRHNSTDYHGNDILLTSTFSHYSEIRFNGPTGSGIWYPSNVNTIEIGVRTRA